MRKLLIALLALMLLMGGWLSAFAGNRQAWNKLDIWNSMYQVWCGTYVFTNDLNVWASSQVYTPKMIIYGGIGKIMVSSITFMNGDPIGGGGTGIDVECRASTEAFKIVAIATTTEYNDRVSADNAIRVSTWSTIPSGNYFNDVKVSSALYSNDSDKLDGQHGNYYASVNSTNSCLPLHGTADDSAKLNGQSASYYATVNSTNSCLPLHGTADDSAKLGGQEASYYANVNATNTANATSISAGSYLNDIKVSSAIYAISAANITGELNYKVSATTGIAYPLASTGQIWAWCGSSYSWITMNAGLWEVTSSTYLRPITANQSIIPNGIMDIGSPYPNGGINNIWISTNDYVWGGGKFTHGGINWVTGPASSDVVHMYTWGSGGSPNGAGIMVDGIINSAVNAVGDSIACWGTGNAKNFEFHLGGWCGSSGNNSLALYRGQTDGHLISPATMPDNMTKGLSFSQGDYGAWNARDNILINDLYVANVYLGGLNGRIYDMGSGVINHNAVNYGAHIISIGTDRIMQLSQSYVFIGNMNPTALPIYFNVSSLRASTITADGSSYWSNSIYTPFGFYGSTGTFSGLVKVSSITLLNGDPIGNGNYLPLSGGVMTGDLTGTNIIENTAIIGGCTFYAPTVGTMRLSLGNGIFELTNYRPYLYGDLPYIDLRFSIGNGPYDWAGTMRVTELDGSGDFSDIKFFVHGSNVMTNYFTIHASSLSALTTLNACSNILQTGNNTITNISSTTVRGYEIVKGSFVVVGNGEFIGTLRLKQDVSSTILKFDSSSGNIGNIDAGSINGLIYSVNGVRMTFNGASGNIIRWSSTAGDTIVSTYTINTGDMDYAGRIKSNELYVVTGSTFNGNINQSGYNTTAILSSTTVTGWEIIKGSIVVTGNSELNFVRVSTINTMGNDFGLSISTDPYNIVSSIRIMPNTGIVGIGYRSIAGTSKITMEPLTGNISSSGTATVAGEVTASGVPLAAKVTMLRTATGFFTLPYSETVQTASTTAQGCGASWRSGMYTLYLSSISASVLNMSASNITFMLAVANSTGTWTYITNEITITGGQQQTNSAVITTATLTPYSPVYLHIVNGGDGNANQLLVTVHYWYKRDEVGGY